MYGLRRSGSTTSLASMAGDRKFNSGGGGGAIKLELDFQRPSASDKKTAGKVNILVREARKLQAQDPYVKLYLSIDGKDQKGTKQKTKVVKKSTDPVFEDRFVYFLDKKKTKINNNNRVQVTIWDAKAGLKHNECIGGLSFSLEELSETDKVIGWYSLMPEVDGRICNEFLTDAEDIDPTLIPGPSAPPQLQSKPSKREKKDKKASKKDKEKEKVIPVPQPEPVIEDLDEVANRFASRFERSPKLERKALPEPQPSSLSQEQKIPDEESEEEEPVIPTPQQPEPEEAEEEEEEEELPEVPITSPSPAKVQQEGRQEEVTREEEATEEDPSPVEPVSSLSSAISTEEVNTEPFKKKKNRRGSRQLPQPGSKSDTTPLPSDSQEPDIETSQEEPVQPPPPQQQQQEPQPEPPAASIPVREPTSEGVLAKQVRATLGTRGGSGKSSNSGAISKASSQESQSRTVSEDPILQPSTNLKRTNSMNSLISVAESNVISGNAEGELQLYMYYEPMNKDSKAAGLLHVSVNEGRDLATKEPYVKMYLSKNNVNIKNTKQKTKSKKTKNPVFQERFVFKILKSMSLDEKHRLQIMVWDHARARANECMGGMSFTLMDIASTSRINGWFRVLPYREGRSNHLAVMNGSSPNVGRKEYGNLGNGAASIDTGSIGSGRSGSENLSGPIGLPPVPALKSMETPSATPVATPVARKSSRGITSVLLSGKVTKKEAEKLNVQLQEAQEREEMHIREKGELHEKLNQLRQEMKETNQLESNMLKLRVQLSDATKELQAVEHIKKENEDLKEQVEDLTVRIEHLNDFVKLHTDDANRHTEEKVKLRDALSDQRDENRGLRNFIGMLQDELLKSNPKAFQKILAMYSSQLESE